MDLILIGNMKTREIHKFCFFWFVFMTSILYNMCINLSFFMTLVIMKLNFGLSKQNFIDMSHENTSTSIHFSFFQNLWNKLNAFWWWAWDTSTQPVENLSPLLDDHLIMDIGDESAPTILATIVQESVKSPIVTINYVAITESMWWAKYFALESFEINETIFDTAVEIYNTNQVPPLFWSSHELIDHLRLHWGSQSWYSKAVYLMPSETILRDTQFNSSKFPDHSLINKAFMKWSYTINHLRWVVWAELFDSLFEKKHIDGKKYYVSKTNSTDSNGGTIFWSKVTVTMWSAKNNITKSVMIQLFINRDHIHIGISGE